MASANKQIEKPLVYEFSNHILFLQQWLKYLKVQYPGWSIRKLTKDCGLAIGYFSMVFSNQRKLSDNAFDKILPHLKLNSSEKNFLFHLRKLNVALSPEQRSQALAQLQKFKAYKQDHKQEHEVFHYLKRWENVAIREIVNLQDFKPNIEWIQSRLRGRFGQQELQNALDFLKEHKFLIQKIEGQLNQAEKLIHCSEDVYKLSLSDFHRQVLKLAIDSIDEVTKTQRVIKGHTMAIESDKFAQASEILEKCINDIRLLAAPEGKGDEVYHLEIALFPLTQGVKGMNK